MPGRGTKPRLSGARHPPDPPASRAWPQLRQWLGTGKSGERLHWVMSDEQQAVHLGAELGHLGLM